MRKWWIEWKKQILDDELYFRRQVRSLVLTVSIGASALADQIAGVFGVPHPKLITTIRIAGFVAVFLALRIRMGDKNPSDPPAPGVQP